MPSLTLSDRRLIWFAHCPKAGGTSVERMMVETWGDRVGHLAWGWDIWWRSGGWRTADPPNSPQHLTWADAAPRLGRRPDAIFAVVRDPVARFASEHRYQRRHRRGTRAGRILARLPFSLWARLMLRVAERHAYAYDNHLRPQSDFIPEGCEIFRLEDGLAPVAEWLETVTGRPMPTPKHALRTGASRGADTATCARIEGAFAADYARFGYARTTPPPDRPDALDRLAAALAPVVVWLDRRGRL